MVVMVVGLFCLPPLLLTIACIDKAVNPSSRFRDSRLIALAESAAAWFLGLIFLTGGMSKLVAFPGVMGPVWLEQVLEPYGLALFARFIAWSEVVIGLLLLAKPTRVLASIMMVPMLLNILMITVSMQWRGTPAVIVFFLSINVFLLAFHCPRWRSVIDYETIPRRQPTNPKHRAVMGCMIVIVTSPILAAVSIYLCWTANALSLAGLIWYEWELRYATTAPQPLKLKESESTKTQSV